MGSVILRIVLFHRYLEAMKEHQFGDSASQALKSSELLSSQFQSTQTMRFDAQRTACQLPEWMSSQTASSCSVYSFSIESEQPYLTKCSFQTCVWTELRKESLRAKEANLFLSKAIPQPLRDFKDLLLNRIGWKLWFQLHVRSFFVVRRLANFLTRLWQSWFPVGLFELT